MMATEAVVDRSADASASASESRSATDARNVDIPTINGSALSDDIENKRITSVEDQINSADVSVSGGSDTEASKTDVSRIKDGDKGHGRTGSSVKKPATFKAVSVNKTFLAAKASANASAAKGSDKPPSGSSTPPMGSATLSATRPRLVAKTGSGGGNSLPRSSMAGGGKPATAPDPSAVWNKNRPVPPPEPKKFTDEELKKYGIHMASRLNEDDAQGQNKWADIDDDDEDWAPEAITWGDGTKTTVPHPEEHPPPPSENGSVASKGKGLDKPRSPAPLYTGSPLSKPSGLASGKGLVLKSGSQDRPTLVAKPPAPPAPVKSPWAPLPPIEKASPIVAEAHLSRHGHRELLPPKGMTPPPKEIAADDFSRSSWRDGHPHGNRELFNAHSGRYEPAPDRRGSMRMDQHPKHPSLLQRPSQSDYPEPSGAFQTNRVSQEVPFGRRRGSSNVSGGSGQYYLRLGKGIDGPIPPPEHLSARRTSFAGSVDSPISPGNLSVHPHQPGWVPRSSPRAAFAVAHQSGPHQPGPHQSGPHPPGPPPEAVMGPPPAAPPLVDEVEYQKKLMSERRELARKRREEEEAREEAAKQERIQKKLESLGPAPEKKSDKKESSPKVEVSKPTQIQQRELSRDSSNQSTTGAGKPATSGRKEARETDVKATPQSKPPGHRRVSQSQDTKPVDLWGAAASTRQERFTSWGPGSQQSARNVWGSPNNDRGLGNGTFNTDIARVGADGSGSQSGKGPAPIAPPATSSRASSQGAAQAPAPAPIGSRGPRYGAPGTDLASKWVNAVTEGDKNVSATKMAERAERERQLAERGLTLEDAQPIIKDTWRQVHAPGDGTRRPVAVHETQSHQVSTWRNTGDDLAKSAPQEDLPPPSNAGVIGSGGHPMLPQGSKGGSSQGRASRFFPAKDIRTEGGLALDPARSKSPTPPPPTMEGHPAYEGDVMRPHVSLPKPQPIVKLPPSGAGPQHVQPRPQSAWANPPSFKEARAPVHPHRGPMTAGEKSQETWQNRINSLLNGQKSPQLQHRSIVVDPASKSALDHIAHHDSATVSLPSPALPPTPTPAQTQFQSVRYSRSPTTKPMAEECFEEQEMGSLPQIRFPRYWPPEDWEPATPQTKPLPKRFLIQATGMEPYYFAAEIVGGGNAMRIQFPGMGEPKIVTVPFSATRGGRTSHPRAGPRHRGSGHERRGGKRDVSSSRASSRGEHTSSSGSRGGRGGYRSRGSDNWSRHSTPPSLPA